MAQYIYLAREREFIETSNDENITTICTFEDFIKYSSIQKIIITNRKKQEGFLRFSDQIWFKIWDKDSLHIDSEILLLWLENNLLYYNSRINFDYDKIIKDICKKCYIKDPPVYKLKYHEFVICYNSRGYRPLTQYILDTTTFKLYNLDYIIKDNILYGCDKSSCLLGRTITENITDISDIDISIVDDILCSLINDKDILNKYKKLCYNIFVKQETDETIIFTDYSNKVNLLTIFLRDSIYHISNSQYCIYDNSKGLKHYMKEFKKYGKPRVVFIELNDIKSYGISGYDKTKYIDYFKNKLGIKNIVISGCRIHSSNTDLYNYEAYIDYIINNKERIQKLLACNLYDNKEDEEPYSISLDRDFEIKAGSYDHIFYSPRMLFNNFFKWCCSAYIINK